MLQEFTARFDRWALTNITAPWRPGGAWSTVADVAANAHLKERGFFVDFAQPPFGHHA